MSDSQEEKGMMQTAIDLIIDNMFYLTLLMVFIIMVIFRDNIMNALPFKFGGGDYHISNAFGITE
jgi:hypothetical protein